MTGGNGPHYTDVAGMNSQSFVVCGSSGFWVLPCFLGAQPPNPRHLPLWTNGMKNAAGVPLGASGRGGYAGPAVVEDIALGESTPSAGATRGIGDVIVHGGIASLISCCWRKAKNARGPGTASPVFAWCRFKKYPKTG